MSVAKLKNIVLLIMLLTNLFLLGQVVVSARRSTEYRETALTAAIDLLGDSGIALRRDSIPVGAMPAALRFERDRAGETALAQLLLGEDAHPDVGSGTAAGLYRSDAGTLRLYADGTLEAFFTEGTHTATGDGPEGHALRLLKSIGIEGQVIGSAVVGQTSTVTVRQTQDGWPVFSCTLTCTYVGDSLTGVSGRRVSGPPVAAGERAARDDVMTMTTLLVRFRNGLRERGDVCSEILSIEPGYELVSAFTEPNRLIPCLTIRVDGDRHYYLNMQTGQLQPV